jgi:ABC-type antimicrobial peptide transport system permease subunit
MKGLLLKLSMKGNKRIVFTIIGIAVCIMYLTGTIGMVGGLDVGTTKLSDRVKQGPVIAFDESLNSSFIPQTVIEELTGDHTSYRIAEVELYANDTRVLTTYAFSSANITEKMKDAPENFSILGSDIVGLMVELNISVAQGSNLTLAASGTSFNVSYNSTYIALQQAGTKFPNDWILVSNSTIKALKPALENGYSFLILPQENERDIEYLRSSGYETMQTASFLGFFEHGIYQIENDLWGIIAASAIVITILVYSIMSIEVQYKIEDIRILRYLGGSRKLVMGVFVLKSFFISLLGGILGVALGVVAMNAITSFSPLIGFNTLVIPQASWFSVALPFFVAVLFGLVGGMLPSYKASRLEIRRGEAIAA